MRLSTILTITSLLGGVTAQDTTSSSDTTLNGTFSYAGPHNVRYDTGSYGPPVEEFHYFYDQWPIGLAISKIGRVFTCYTRGTYAYTLGEVVNQTAEAAYPSLQLNAPPGGLYTESNGIQFGSNLQDYFISVQALFVTPDDTLWVLDTGRPTINESQSPSMPYAVPGGPKLVAINLANDSIIRTYTFPAHVHYPDSYLNDLRFDQRNNITESGGGVAYLVDSSNEGRNGFIILDLGTGESWRMLNQHYSVLRVQESVASYNGIPSYLRQLGTGVGFQAEGLDGLELSLYGDILYYSPLTSSTLYSIPTSYLLTPPSVSPLASKLAMDNVHNLGQRGGNANGFASDSLGNIYMLMPSQNAIFMWNSTISQAVPFVRDPRILWPDSANAGFDGWLYWTVNQLPYQPDWNEGVDGRVKPGVLLRCRLPVGAGKNMLLV